MYKLNFKFIVLILMIILIIVLGGLVYYIFKSNLSAVDSSANSFNNGNKCPEVTDLLCPGGYHKITGVFTSGQYINCSYQHCVLN